MTPSACWLPKDYKPKPVKENPLRIKKVYVNFSGKSLISQVVVMDGYGNKLHVPNYQLPHTQSLAHHGSGRDVVH